MLRPLSHFLTRASRLLFWPGVALVIWGELWADPAHMDTLAWDKAEHFIAYFGLAAMATMIVRRGRRLGLALLGVVALGGVLELLQSVTGRDAEWSDMLANTLGALAGLAVASALLALVGGSPRD